jgi:hypothetical protein
MDLDDDANDFICYKKDPTKDDGKIALPEWMLVDMVSGFSKWRDILMTGGCMIRWVNVIIILN